MLATLFPPGIAPVLEENKRLHERVREPNDLVRRLTAELRDKAKANALAENAVAILCWIFDKDGDDGGDHEEI